MRSSALVVALALLGCSDAAPSSDTGGSTTGATATSGESSSGGSSDGSPSTSSVDSSGDGSSSDTGALLPECPSFARGEMIGTVASPQIVEASGLAASRMHEGVLWVHNDSGDGARVFAIDRAGATLAEIGIAVPLALDWEDMAIGPGPEPGVEYLYLGDIGDNGEIRSTITVYRIAEPDPADGDATIDDVTAIVLDYPDGSHNAETLLVDPGLGDLVVVTKARTGTSGVFRAAAPHGGGATIELEQIGSLAFGSPLLPGNTLTTGGDIAADGSLVAIRTYDSAFAWRRAVGASLADALATEPCPLPLAAEEQGETLALDDDGMITISEGVSQPVWFFARQ